MSARSEVQSAAVFELAVGRRGRLRAYLFEVATAVAFPVLGVAYFLDPDQFAMRSVIGHRVYPFDYLWSAGYVVGGLLVLAGVFLPRMRLRALGLILLGTAISLQTVAAISVAPQLRDAFNAVYAVACFARAYLLTRLFARYRLLPIVGRDEARRAAL